jgi:hypothetical protein
MNRNMLRISNNCIQGKNIPSSLLDIQKNMDMTDNEFSDLLSKNINKIKTLLDETPKPNPSQITNLVEKFINPVKEGFQSIKYIDVNQRGLNQDILSDYITSNANVRNSVKTSTPLSRTYGDDMVKTREYIEQQMDNYPSESPVESLFNKEKNWTENKFYKTNWCMVDYNNKNYCFSIDNNYNLCEFGKIVDNRSNCNF